MCSKAWLRNEWCYESTRHVRIKCTVQAMCKLHVCCPTSSFHCLGVLRAQSFVMLTVTKVTVWYNLENRCAASREGVQPCSSFQIVASISFHSTAAPRYKWCILFFHGALDSSILQFISFVEIHCPTSPWSHHIGLQCVPTVGSTRLRGFTLLYFAIYWYMLYPLHRQTQQCSFSSTYQQDPTSFCYIRGCTWHMLQ